MILRGEQMNRKQKRHANKHKATKTTVFNHLANVAIETLTERYDKSRPRIGDKCKINIEKLISRKDWERLNPAYKQFVLDNVDTIFTVQEDKFKPKNDGFVATVALAEDTTEPKWLWCVDDLIKVED
jgi:hypothetical protein